MATTDLVTPAPHDVDAREPGPEAGSTATEAAPTRPSKGGRLLSLDAARGLAIVVMLFAMNPGPRSGFPAQFRHPEWHGLTFIDLFFPLFLFAMGVSMTLSARGLSTANVLRRAAVLFAFGVALTSLRHQQLWLTGVLQHIAGSYVLAYAVLRLPRRWHLPMAVAVVAGVWAAFVAHAWGSDPWGTSGTAAHAVDGWLHGRFSTEGTLQTVISTVTVLGGAFAGYLVRALPDRRELLRALVVRAVALMALGLLIAQVVPINKRLWSPSFAVLTVGTSFAFVALGVWLADIRGARRTVAPLVHLGMNPIAIYVMFFASFAALRNWGGFLPTLAPAGGATADVFVYAAVWTVLWWGVAYALYRRGRFLRL